MTFEEGTALTARKTSIGTRNTSTNSDVLDWEINLQGEWKLLGVIEVQFLEQLEENGQSKGTVTVRDQLYEFDIEEMYQRNLTTGKLRDIRRKERERRMTMQRRTGMQRAQTGLQTMKRFLRSFSSAAEPEPVILHVYDVGTDPKISTANGVLRILGTGAYHAAIEIYGCEWSYGYTDSGTGVFWCEATKCEMHQYREAVELGKTKMTREEVDDLLDELSEEWSGQSYHLLRHNCCHFSNEFSKRVCSKPIPGWVMNLAGTGASAETAVLKFQEAKRMGAQARLQLDDSAPVGSYRFGDVTRGMVAMGKEFRGGSRKGTTHFGDCARGVCKMCCFS